MPLHRDRKGCRIAHLEALDQAIRLGYRDFKWLAKDPDLKKLRAQPAFDELKEKIKQLKGKSR